MPRRTAFAFLLIAAFLGTACSKPSVVFSESNARVHIGMLAGTFGSRPVGSPANERARAYIVDQLRLYGYDVRVQEADARRPELGLTARVANIIAVKPGARREAIGILSHYDSHPHAPGAADDAYGVAVSLEAARTLAARAGATWSLMVLITDAEEIGLMGAAALMTDREVTDRLQTYVNLDSAGSKGPAILFENGPGNAWLLRPWAAAAPHPRGASFGIEIYRRLPNDTDFSILKRHEIPGLNFAPVGDSYAYHTARDVPERVGSETIRHTGENVVAIVNALDGTDITQRSPWLPTYFDIGGTVALSYGPAVGWVLSSIALLAGVIAWFKVTAAAVRMAGLGRWVLTLVWTVIGAAAVAGSMTLATAALRAAREYYHPWYARPDRLFVLLLVVGSAVAWSIARIGQWLPARVHGLRHPLLTWSLALPVWIALACFALWSAPGAAHLWVAPLLVAGILFSLIPPTYDTAVRVASVLVFAVVATFWLRPTIDLLRFAVAIFGRLPIVTPHFVYAAIMAAAGLMLVPPLAAAATTTRPLVRPKAFTALLLAAAAGAAGFAYAAPAYTFEQPLRREVRALQDRPDAGAVWEVGSVEPGLDLGPGAPGGWSPPSGPPSTSVPWRGLPQPFVFRTSGPSLGRPPASVAAATVEPLAEGVELSLEAVPQQPGLTISVVLPGGVAPARANLPGVVRSDRWTASFAAVPLEGMRFRATFARTARDRLRDTRLIVTSSRIPGGEGWQSLPAWLPQEHTVWNAAVSWVVDPFADRPIAPVPPLR